MRETSVFLMNTRKRQKLYDLFCRQATKDYGLTRNELDVLLLSLIHISAAPATIKLRKRCWRRARGEQSNETDAVS